MTNVAQEVTNQKHAYGKNTPKNHSYLLQIKGKDLYTKIFDAKTRNWEPLDENFVRKEEKRGQLSGQANPRNIVAVAHIPKE